MTATTTRTARTTRLGFTLIELLIVMTVISLLAVALLPMITETQEVSEITATKSRLTMLDTAINRFQRDEAYGFYPPDDFSDPALTHKLKLKRDGVNPGIESLLIHLHRSDYQGSTSLEESLAEWLENTDDDKGSGMLGRLDTSEMMEVVDYWGQPIAYFTKNGYGRAQTYVAETGEQEVKAWKDKNGKFLRRRSYQLFSAGPDGAYNTEDDVALYDLPR